MSCTPQSERKSWYLTAICACYRAFRNCQSASKPRKEQTRRKGGKASNINCQSFKAMAARAGANRKKACVALALQVDLGRTTCGLFFCPLGTPFLVLVFSGSFLEPFWSSCPSNHLRHPRHLPAIRYLPAIARSTPFQVQVQVQVASRRFPLNRKILIYSWTRGTEPRDRDFTNILFLSPSFGRCQHTPETPRHTQAHANTRTCRDADTQSFQYDPGATQRLNVLALPCH